MSSLPQDLATFLGLPDFSSQDFVLNGTPQPVALPGSVPYVPSPIAPDQQAQYLQDQMHQKYAEEQAAKTQPVSNPAASSPAPCPKGDKYLASQWEVFFGCSDGYARPQFSDYCMCQQGGTAPGASPTNLFGLANSDTGKYLPYLILGAIVLFIFGGKR